jgi:uncharacterized protein YjbJ (UPF0337 family)
MTDQTPNQTKAEGTGDKLGGQVKETVGKATGDESLERQGENDQRKGSLKKAWGNVKDAFSSK